jgi:hypothetical protein
MDTQVVDFQRFENVITMFAVISTLGFLRNTDLTDLREFSF